MRNVFLFAVLVLVLAVPFETMSRPRPGSGVTLGNDAEGIALSKHNLSSTWDTTKGGLDPRVIKAKNITEICVFCHTPHAATNSVALWNRDLSYQDSTAYTPYQPQINIMKGISYMGSMDTSPGQPTGYSKLCLSCHDGSLAIGNVNNAPGSGLVNTIPDTSTDEKIAMEERVDAKPSTSWTAKLDAIIPAGRGAKTGYTRRLGIDLSNDHPISMKLDQALINVDNEMKEPDDGVAIGNKSVWNKKGITEFGVRRYPQGFNGSFPEDYKYVQCTSCHNPHLKTSSSPKFLRARITNDFPGDTNKRTQLCEACHIKDGWVKSTHEDSPIPYVGDQSSPIPEMQLNIPVGEKGCLNCHDPHTASGSDRLHKNGASAGYTPAIENTCFQCHLSASTGIVPVMNSGKFVKDIPGVGGAPDIKSVFEKNTNTAFSEMSGGGSSMPLDRSWADTNANSTNGLHQPVFVPEGTLSSRRQKNVTEEQVLNKPDDISMIHVECTDCHNPHQVNKKNRMRGMKGITIDGFVIGGDSGGAPPNPIPGTGLTPYTDDRGVDPGTGRIEPLIYEVCLRCHGDSFAYNMPYIAKGAIHNYEGTRLLEKRDRGHVQQGLSQLSYGQQFGASNKATEFNPDSDAKSRPRVATGAGDDRISYLTYNTSYHPVAAPGRNGSVALYNQLMKAFDLCGTSLCTTYLNESQLSTAADALGNLTIQCTDCHNNSEFDDQTNSNHLPLKDSHGFGDNYVIGPLTGLNGGKYGDSYKRSSDRPSSLSDANQDDPDLAQGPHGSANPRILRSPYNTMLGFAGDPTDEWYKLCFRCHEKSVFLNLQDEVTLIGTNFGSRTRGTGRTWNANLHYYHLFSETGGGSPTLDTKPLTPYGAKARCHECHNNVHSNVEANNTTYGDGETFVQYDPSFPASNEYCEFGCLPSDDKHDGIADGKIDTHLLNFAPNVEGSVAAYPRWFMSYERSTSKIIYRCDLVCHRIEGGDHNMLIGTIEFPSPPVGTSMNSCWYTHTAKGDTGEAQGLCAGWG